MTDASASAPRTDIPYLAGISIDGDPSDWGDRGLRVGVMKTFAGRVRSPEDFSPSFRLGWNEEGLLLLVTVYDDVVIEAEPGAAPGVGDSVEVWIDGKRRDRHVYQISIAPGVGDGFPEPRIVFTDDRQGRDTLPELSAKVASRPTEHRYIVEALLPWSNLGITPERGMEIGFMLVVSDVDGVPAAATRTFWNPAWVIPDLAWSHGVTLSGGPSDPILGFASAGYLHYRHVRVDVRTSTELAGRTLVLREGDRILAESLVRREGGAGVAEFMAPTPPVGSPYGELRVCDGDSLICTATLPGSRDLLQGKTLVEANLRFDSSVFSGNTFPGCDFEHPLLAEEIIGAYKIERRFFDSEHNEVLTAQRPGRYGAVVRIIPADGRRALTRYRTLYRSPAPIPCRWHSIDITANPDAFYMFGSIPIESVWRRLEVSPLLPPELGIDPEIAASESALRGYSDRSFVRGFRADPLAGAVFAGTHEASNECSAEKPDDILVADRQWWVEMKRRLNGDDMRYPEPFICPKPVDGPSAPVLREGSLGEAGMKPDARDRIDAVCREWAADSDQRFAVLVARHGVIVIHDAYGARNGQPMTVTTQSWMASITKCMSANLMWMLVDQGIVGLDDPIEDYLPSLRGIRTDDPIKVGQLYDHTSGFVEGEHWGDEMNDLEEILADFYPYLKTPALPAYNGIGLAIGGKIIEAVSGESIPVFFTNHLLDPLGCEHTDVYGTNADAESIPRDIGRIAQLMLNGGSYGKMRFYGKETLTAMLPPTPEPSAPTNPAGYIGVGLMGFGGEGMGEGTFGHGAASATTLRVDPVNDLVIVMTRDSIGANYARYHQRFIDSVMGGLL